MKLRMKILYFLFFLTIFTTSVHGQNIATTDEGKLQTAILNRPIYRYSINATKSTEDDHDFVYMDITSKAGNMADILGDNIYKIDSLEQIVFPATLKLLGQESFSYIPELKRIYCMATEPPVCEESTLNPGDTPFGDYEPVLHLSTHNDIPVYVPVGTADKYRNAWGWDHFTNIIETDNLPTAIHDVTTERSDAKSSIYDLNGRKVTSPLKGQVYIKNGKKIIFAR